MSKIRVDSKNPLVTYSSLGVTSKVMSQWKFARDWAKIQLISCDRQRLERLNLPDLWYTFSSPPPPCYHWHVISNAAPSHRLWNVCSICTQPLQYVVELGTEMSRVAQYKTELDSERLVFSYFWTITGLCHDTSSKCCRTPPTQFLHQYRVPWQQPNN